MNWIKSKWFSGLVFSLLFAGLCWYFNYNDTFFQSPQSVHIWRQTNSLSMTQMYYQYNVPFFQPEIQSQVCDQGTSGKTVGEFPIIYYAMAKVWKIFGKSEWSFRVFQLLMLFSGLFLLFRMLTPITGNQVRAGFISMLVFTSPMIIFYSPNFLPDGPALAFIFIAWFFLYQFVKKRKYYALWISAVFFFLAISLKIIIATSFIAVGAWILLETLFMKSEKRIFNFRIKHYIPFIITILLSASWYLYVQHYNDLHKGLYSYFAILPVWKMSKEQFDHVIEAVNLIFFKEYFNPILQFATVAIWIFMLFQIRKIKPFLGYLLIIMPISMLSILLLWFQVYDAHDYYMISQVPVFVIVWAIFFNYLKDKKFGNHPVSYALMLVIFILLANNGMTRHKLRYTGWMNDEYTLKMKALTEIEPYFEKWNIKPEDKVISIPDNSLTASLYYMNRKGYTNFFSDFTQEGEFRKRIYQGATYLIILDSSILDQPVLQKFTTRFVGQYQNVKVYDLKPIIR